MLTLQQGNMTMQTLTDQIKALQTKYHALVGTHGWAHPECEALRVQIMMLVDQRIEEET